MLMKIGEVTNKFGISHRSLHYWESAGILQSSRGENDYRFYDEENIQKIKQIMFLRKLRLSIPSIQEIFTSNEFSKVVAVFSEHLDETKKETDQLNALGLILNQLLNMLKNRQNMDSVYKYLDTTHSVETEELKEALKTVLSELEKEIAIETIPEAIVDMTNIDLSLETMRKENISAVTEIIKLCYQNTKEMDKLLFYFNIEQQLSQSDCTWVYKIMQNGECIGCVNLAYVGMEAMVIRCFVCLDSETNIYIFELLKRKFPHVLSWNIYIAQNDDIEEFTYDFEGKKKQFADDNSFVFYTDSRWNRYLKMLKSHDEVYNSSRYRFALLDGSMDGVSFRFFGVDKLDFYDGRLTNCRMTDVDFSNALIYDTWLENDRFSECGFITNKFDFSDFNGSKFNGCNFENCTIENSNIEGLTIDGVKVTEALKFYRNNK